MDVLKQLAGRTSTFENTLPGFPAWTSAPVKSFSPSTFCSSILEIRKWQRVGVFKSTREISTSKIGNQKPRKQQWHWLDVNLEVEKNKINGHHWPKSASKFYVMMDCVELKMNSLQLQVFSP